MSQFDIMYSRMKNGPVPPGRLRKLLDGFGGKRILVAGDLMLDHFIRGRVSRLSPEAPVPVVRVASETLVPGGAGNVAGNIAALGARAEVAGLTGPDEAGRELVSILRSRGVETRGVVADPERPTTQKCRVIADHQQVVRYDRETAGPVGRRTQEELAAAVESGLSRAHGLILSDYGKGVITPFFLKRAIRAARRAGVPVAVDPKPEHFRLYRGVDCITPNLQEAWAGMRRLPEDREEAIRDLGLRALNALGAGSVLITRGEKGMTLFEGRGRVSHIPARAREVFDVTGAGDTVISVLTLGLASGATPLESAVLANLAAGVVVGKLGTATASVAELRELLR